MEADSQCPESEVDALNAKARSHFEEAEKEGRAQDAFQAGSRATHTTAAYDLISSCPEEVSKL